jgi:xylose isomerase
MIQERKLSMPFWCVGNPVGDPFGPGVLTGVSSIEVAELLAAAGRKGLINYSAAHDDDLVPWDPAKPEDDLDESSEVHKTLVQIKKILTSGNIKFNMIGCALHPDPVFRNGGIANPDPRVRLLAAQKVMRALRIGSFLGADFFTYWVARDGFETQFSVPWDKTYRYLQEALNLVPRYCKTNNLTIKHATIEYKPNEPRGEMFLPTVGHSVALISTLEDPDFWGVNPEVLQHDAMTNLSPVAAVAFAMYMKKLFFLHVGSQKPGQFDNDNPPTIGMDGLKEMVSIIYFINKYNWNGYIEFDNHMLRTDTVPGNADRLTVRERYIEMTVDAYRTVEKKANQLLGENTIDTMQQSVWKDDSALETLLSEGNIERIAEKKIDYAQVVSESIEIGALDLTVNKKILGF